jgi:DNA-binding XRE family transcriptional regulator
MNKTEKKRLEARGWKIGTVKEFLGLSAQEGAFIDIKLALADSLKRRRKVRGWTQAQVARAMRSSQSRVARMEAGDSSVSLDLLIRSLLVLGATRKDVAQAIAARAA